MKWMRGYIDAAKTYLEEEDTSGFNTYLNNIPSEQDFTEDEDANYEDYKSAVTMILNAADQGRSQRELDSLEVDTLLDIANNNDSYVGQYARNILTHFYGYSFSMPDPYPSPIISSTNEQENSNKGYSISPNPSKSNVELAIHSFNIEDEYRFRVYSLSGTLLKQRGFNTNHVSFSVSEYPEGIYIINVTANNKSLGTTKLIVQ